MRTACRSELEDDSSAEATPLETSVGFDGLRIGKDRANADRKSASLYVLTHAIDRGGVGRIAAYRERVHLDAALRFPFPQSQYGNLSTVPNGGYHVLVQERSVRHRVQATRDDRAEPIGDVAPALPGQVAGELAGCRQAMDLAVDVREGKGEVAAYAQELGLSFPVLLDQSGDVALAYRVQNLPRSFLIDRQGRVVRIHPGELTTETIERYLQELL